MSSVFYLRTIRLLTYKMAFATTMSPIFQRFALATKYKGGAVGFKMFSINAKRVVFFKGGKMSVMKGRPLTKLWTKRNEGLTL